MLSGHDHADSEAIDVLLDCVSYLIGQPFLQLKTSRKTVHDPWYLGGANHVPIRNIPYSARSEERQHVMLA